MSPTKILSAAHCFSAFSPAQLLRHIRVRAGSSRFNEKGTVREISRVVLHPDFNKPSRMNNDIAVLILKSKLDLNDREGKMRAIALPRTGESVPSNIDLKVSGWGRTKNAPNAPPAPRLRYVIVKSIDRKLCEEAFRNSEKHTFTDRMFCAGIWGVGGKDACQGDSGGLVTNFIFNCAISSDFIIYNVIYVLLLD